MGEFLQRNIVAIISILISVTLTLTIYFKNKKRKELSYEVLSATSLIMSDDQIRNKIQIMMDGEEIKGDVHLVLLKIKNTGNIHIEPKDFEDDINIDIYDGAILIAEISETKPSNLAVKIDNLGGLLGITSISPLLLNPKDEITVKLLVQDYQNNAVVSSRIAGIKEVVKIKNRINYWPNISFLSSILLVIIGMYITFWSLLGETGLIIISFLIVLPIVSVGFKVLEEKLAKK